MNETFKIFKLAEHIILLEETIHAERRLKHAAILICFWYMKRYETLRHKTMLSKRHILGLMVCMIVHDYWKYKHRNDESPIPSHAERSLMSDMLLEMNAMLSAKQSCIHALLYVIADIIDTIDNNP